jgi:hypothetical protein
LPKYYNNNNFNKNLPNFIIIEDNEIYKPILKYNKESLCNTSVILYSDNKEIIDNLWNYLNIHDIYNKNKKAEVKSDEVKANEVKDNEVNDNEVNDNEVNDNEVKDNEVNDNEINAEVKKYTLDFLSILKIDAIKKLCSDNNITLQKKSEKTNKNINKLKNELINDLLKI